MEQAYQFCDYGICLCARHICVLYNSTVITTFLA